jgi:hypothetical protein
MDARGRTRPDQHDLNYGTYVIYHPVPIEVFVEDRVSWESVGAIGIR